jgi:Xaa-Pro aminopeptidase
MILMNRPRAERVLDAAGLDGLLATSLENVYYLTHVWVESQVGLPRQAQFYAAVARNRLDTPAIACGINEMGNVLANAPAGTVMVPYGKFYRFVEPGAKLSDLDRQIKEWVIDGLGTSRSGVAVALAEALDGLGLARGRIAYDERGLLTEDVKAEVQKLLPGLRLVPGWAIFRQIRAVKTAVELQRMRAVLELNERSIMAAMGVAKPGATELEMVAEYERTVVTAGGRPSISQIFFGSHGSTGYVNGRSATLTAGEVIRFDTACYLDGYSSDIARNFSLGPPTAGPRVQRYYDAVVAGEEAAIAAMRPGVPASAVFHVGVAGTRKAGIPHYDRSHIGHGAGLEIYDIPLLGPNDHTPLEAGMVFQVELPYYELGFPGLQIEDTVLVGEHGSQIIGQLDRSFRVVPH